MENINELWQLLNVNSIEKVYVFYHKNCSDGMGSSYSAWKYFNDNLPDMVVEYIPLANNEPLPVEIKERTVVFFLDIVPLIQYWEDILNYSTVIIIDHHIHNTRLLTGYNHLNLFKLFNNDHSGAILSWHYFHNSEPPLFLKYIEDRDLWKNSLIDSNLICNYIYSHKFTFQDFAKLHNELESNEIKQITSKGETIEIFKEFLNEMDLKNIQAAIIGGYTVPLINGVSNVSEVGNYLSETICAKYPLIHPFAAMYKIDSKGNAIFSLRTSGFIDSSVIAYKCGGGGGHANASGFKIHQTRIIVQSQFLDKLSTIPFFKRILDHVYRHKVRITKTVNFGKLLTEIKQNG